MDILNINVHVHLTVCFLSKKLGLKLHEWLSRITRIVIVQAKYVHYDSRPSCITTAHWPAAGTPNGYRL